MKKTALLCCISFCLVLASVSAIKTLKNSIEDLKETKFGREFPRHGLKLLYWLANNVTIDQNGIISWSDPSHWDVVRGDCGFHPYDNDGTQSRALPVLDSNSGRAYYSVGNLNLAAAQNQLPAYVTQDYGNSQGQQRAFRNLDRVLIRIQTNNPSDIEAVYITQHYEDTSRESEYDPDNSYQISPQLLRQIQNINPAGIASNLQMVYSPNPKLIKFLKQAGYDSSGAVNNYMNLLQCTDPYIGSLIRHARRPQHSPDTKQKCEEHNNIELKVKSTGNGYAKITWRGLPENLVKVKHVTHIGLYNGVSEDLLVDYALNGRTNGSIDTNIYLNPGLQVKLLHSITYTSYIFFSSVTRTFIWSGPQFDDANGVLPTNILSFEASLQLYVKGGYACARLYIKKSFTNWKETFQKSWVGFYASLNDDYNNYYTYQWSINFVKRSDQHYSENYDIYEYESSMSIRPGVLVRFMLNRDYYWEKTAATPWGEGMK